MALTNGSMWVDSQSETFQGIVRNLWNKAYSFNMSTGEQGESNKEVPQKFIKESLSLFQAMFMQENISHVMFEFGSNFDNCKTNRVISSVMIRSFSQTLEYIKIFSLDRPERFLNDAFMISTWSTTQMNKLAEFADAVHKKAYKTTKDRRKKKVFFIPLYDALDGTTVLEERLELFNYFERTWLGTWLVFDG